MSIEVVETVKVETVEVVKENPSGRGGACPGAGRKYGPAGKSARNVRAAIATFVKNSMDGVEALLGQVINGLPKLDSNGNPLRDSDGSVVYVVKPSPIEGLKLMVDLAEFVVPKLSRSDVAVAARLDTSVATTVENVKSIPTAELQARLLASLGLLNDAGEVQDVEPRTVPAGTVSVLTLEQSRLAAADLINRHVPPSERGAALLALDERLDAIVQRG